MVRSVLCCRRRLAGDSSHAAILTVIFSLTRTSGSSCGRCVHMRTWPAAGTGLRNIWMASSCAYLACCGDGLAEHLDGLDLPFCTKCGYLHRVTNGNRSADDSTGENSALHSKSKHALIQSTATAPVTIVQGRTMPSTPNKP